jgi:hypothetical protein
MHVHGGIVRLIGVSQEEAVAVRMNRTRKGSTNTTHLDSDIGERVRFAKKKRPKSRLRKASQFLARKRVHARNPLTPRQKRTIQTLTTRFIPWCEKWLGRTPAMYSRAIHFPEPTADDWIVRVKSGHVEINTQLGTRCTFDSFVVICIHELAHVFVQGIPNKIDAQRVRDSYGDHMMVLFDIQADVLAAEFMRSVYRIDITGMLGIYYDTGSVFADQQIRTWKLDRFLGTVLTLTNAWMIEPPQEGGAPYPVIVPSISAVATEEVLHLLEVRPLSNRMQDVFISLDEFRLLRACYARAHMSRDQYIDAVFTLSCRILGRAGREGTARLPKTIRPARSAGELIDRVVRDWETEIAVQEAEIFYTDDEDQEVDGP